MHLLQREAYDCVTAVVGQILYVFQVTDAPNFGEIDKDAGREPGQPMFDSDAYYYLLQCGFSCRIYTPWSDLAFIERGVDYVREIYGTEWGKDHELNFTPEEIARLQQHTLLHRARIEPYIEAGRYQEVSQNATLEDIQTMLVNGCAVDMTICPIGSRVGHAILAIPEATQLDGQSLWLYRPGRSEPTVTSDMLPSLAGRIRLDRPVTAIWR
jgi:hypothetical protein